MDITTKSAPTWSTLCTCRCDSNGNGKQISINGEARVYSWHIVFAKRENIELGTQVRVLDGATGAVVAVGEVIKSGSCNMLPYSEIFL